MNDPAFRTVRGYQLLENHKNKLTASLEDYLEMIVRGIRKDGYIRVNTLADQLHVKPPSASKMIQKLQELGFIDYEKYGVIRLTEQGEEIGAYLLWRHNVVLRFFTMLSPDSQKKRFVEAELAEHIFSRGTVQSLEDLLCFFKEHPDCYDAFQTYRRQTLEREEQEKPPATKAGGQKGEQEI